MAIIDGTKGIDKAIKNLKHKGGERLKEIHGGIDMGSERHHVIIMDEKEENELSIDSRSVLNRFF